MVYLSRSAEETKTIAAKISQHFKKGLPAGRHGGVIALTGELGAGKTTFTQGFAKGLGIKEKVISPTFILIRQHPLPNSNTKLFHIDLYRLEDVKDFKEIGISEILDNPENMVLIEWAEKIKGSLPPHTVYITIKKTSNGGREIKVGE